MTEWLIEAGMWCVRCWGGEAGEEFSCEMPVKVEILCRPDQMLRDASE